LCRHFTETLVTCGGIQISCPDKADWIPTQNWELKRHRSTAQ
jgi:hypothetical protein